MPPIFTYALKQGPKWKKTRTGKRLEEQWICTTTDGLSAAEAGAALETDAVLDDIGDGHDDDADLLLIDIDIEPYGAAFSTDGLSSKWLTRLVYSSEAGPGGNTDPNPLNRDPEVRWSGDTERRTIVLDYSTPTRLPITNSAGQRSETLPERDFGELALTWIRNEASPNFATLRDYMHVVNDGDFEIDGQTIPAGFAKLHISEATKMKENGVEFYRVHYEFKFKGATLDNPTGGWNPTKIDDVGYYEKVGSELRPILDETGIEVRKPWPLDGAGAKQASPTATPAQLEFNFYPVKNFGVFNFE
jgi:hypothetical protein